VLRDVEDDLLCRFQPQLLGSKVIEEVDERVRVVRGGDLVCLDRVRHRAAPVADTCLFSSSISFFRSIIFSSRPTVSFWNLSRSARRSISLVRWSATSASALFCALTSRAAANTPSTLPRTSL